MADKWQTSRALLARAQKSLAGGVSSPFRAKFPVPLYFRDACGARMEDVDGNRYIDYTLAWGPLILGHAHPRMVEAMREAAAKPHTFGAEHELEYLVAERFQRMVPGAERVAFTSSGSEAVQLALRLARAFTGRDKILKFEGHYHGWMDSILLSYRGSGEAMGPPERPNTTRESRGQPAHAAADVITARWNDIEAVERALSEHEIAGIIMEPVLCNSGCLMPRPEYLEGVARLARAHGALLILDEVITGFRMAPGGAQQHFGITPDLATFGKALACGLPLSAVAGRADVLDQIIAGRGVAFGGTFNGNPVVLAAANAALQVLEDGTALDAANRLGEVLMDGIRQTAAQRSMPLQVTGFGAAFALHFTTRTELADYRDTLQDDREKLSRYLALALEEGVYLLPDGRVYVSTAHGEQELEETLAAMGRVFERLA